MFETGARGLVDNEGVRPYSAAQAELWCVVFLKLTNDTDELYFDASMLQPLAIFGPNCDGALHTLAIHVQWGLFTAILLQLHIYHLSIVGII